jgi:hypothetical protein
LLRPFAQTGTSGEAVYDWLHARAARKAGVAELVTDNFSDFIGLEDAFTVVPP